MKLHKFALLATIAVGSLFASACTSNTDTAHKKSTAFGLWSFEPHSYAVNDKNAAVIRTDDISGMELASGDRLELFWGLIVVEDY